jgi:hypothetical protein
MAAHQPTQLWLIDYQPRLMPPELSRCTSSIIAPVLFGVIL